MSSRRLHARSARIVSTLVALLIEDIDLSGISQGTVRSYSKPGGEPEETTEVAMKSELKFWRWAAVIGILVLGIVGSIATAAPKGGGGARSSNDRTVFRAAGPAGQPADLAKELGVTTSKLRDTLDAVRNDLGPPGPPPSGGPPSRADLEKRCNQLTDALAAKLGTSGDKVRAAIKTVIKNRIEADVDANRITRAQGDRMIVRIDDAGCLPPLLGIHGPGGCMGGPGHGRRDFAPPPGDSGRPAAPPAPDASAAL
jgi:hypothetical protein